MLDEGQRHIRQRRARDRHRVDRHDRIVPIVDAAEEDISDGTGRRWDTGGRRNSERNDANQRREMRVVRECDRIYAPDREQSTDVEVTLRVGPAQKNIAVQQQSHQRGVVVREHFGATRFVIVHILDDERIVQIDDRRNRASMREEIVPGVPLHDRDVRLGGVALQRLRRDRIDAATGHFSGIAREQRHLVAVGEQDLRHLQKSNADTGRMAMAKRLGAHEQRTRHPRPFTRSTMVCNFHVRDLKIASSRFCIRATSACSAPFVRCSSTSTGSTSERRVVAA